MQSIRVWMRALKPWLMIGLVGVVLVWAMPAARDSRAAPTTQPQSVGLDVAEDCWTGVWPNFWNQGGGFEMTLVQTGTGVGAPVTGFYMKRRYFGLYPFYEDVQGTVTGVIVGSMVVGTWADPPHSGPADLPGESGQFYMAISDDCTATVGQSRHGTSSGWDNTFGANRVSAKPAVIPPAEPACDGSGTWQMTGAYTSTLNLRQADTGGEPRYHNLTGPIDPPRDGRFEGLIPRLGGGIHGSTVYGTWYGAPGIGQYDETGELVIAMARLNAGTARGVCDTFVGLWRTGFGGAGPWQLVWGDRGTPPTTPPPTPTPIAQPPAPLPVALTVTTDQAEYRVGEQVRICYTVPGPGPVTLTDILPDGRSQVLLSGMDDGRGDCIEGTAAPPTGRECFRLEYAGDVGSGVQEVCVQIIGVAAPAPTPTRTPTPRTQDLPPARCSDATNSGGAGVTTRTYEMGARSGTFTFAYETFTITDKIEISYEGHLVWSTPGFVGEAKQVSVSFGPGTATSITVVVTGNPTDTGTAWNYTVHCPGAGPGTGAPAPAPTTSSGAAAAVTADKRTYHVGEAIRICYTVPGPGPITLTDITPDGRQTVLLSGTDDGRGDCLTGTVALPIGTECFRLDYQSSRGSGSTQTCITVTP